MGQKIQSVLYSQQRFSSGEKTLFSKTNKENYNILSCNQKFKNKNYKQAANCFQELVKANPKEPEPLIYYNNSLARDRGNFLTIAVVVPTDNNNMERAKKILRGVAQAQNEYNKKTDFSQNNKSRLLEIIMANDNNKPKISKKVAQEIVQKTSILGVIGHNSSDATDATLEVYEKANLPVISSTSTSTELKSDTFFRTVIDNSVMTQKLAEYIQSQSIEKIVIFYNKESVFSGNLKDYFDSHLKTLKSSIKVTSINLNQPPFDIKQKVQGAVDNQVEVGMLFSNLEKIDLAVQIAQANDQLPESQRLKLFAGDPLYDCDTLNKDKQAFKGLILAVPWHKELPAAQTFVTEPRDLWGEEEEIDWRTATSYDAAKAFIYALSNSGDNPSRTTVLEKLKEVNLPSNKTSGQNLRFNPDREIIGEAILVEVVESKGNPDCPNSNLDFRLVEE
ncbi:MAG: ABC transporter substrate-binding protein [Cyanobacteria bacterium P01_H01_bin.35]